MNPFKSKKGLGRGLSSLIGDSPVTSSNNKISISSIVRNKFQPRKTFDKENLEELSNSIKERGIIQPVVVRKSADKEKMFEIISGERRWLAAQNAGLHEIPVIEIEADDLKSLEFAIVELSSGHAKVLVGLENASFVAKKFVEKKLSVRQAENLVKIFKNKKVPKHTSKDPNLKQLERTLIEKIGLNVSINNKRNNSGNISFQYKNLDQLNRIIDLIKNNY